MTKINMMIASAAMLLALATSGMAGIRMPAPHASAFGSSGAPLPDYDAQAADAVAFPNDVSLMGP